MGYLLLFQTIGNLRPDKSCLKSINIGILEISKYQYYNSVTRLNMDQNLENEILDYTPSQASSKIKQKLFIKMILLPFIFWIMFYLFLEFTDYFPYLKNVVIGCVIGNFFGLIIHWYNKNFIYKISTNNTQLTLQITNSLGNDNIQVFDLKKIENIDFKKKNFWRSFDKVNIQMQNKKYYYYSINQKNKEKIESIQLES